MDRVNYHKKNSSALCTARTKKSSTDSKSKKKHASGSKEKQADLLLQNKIKKRMSFASPSRKDGSDGSKGPINSLNLLTYMLYREKHPDSVTALMSHRQTTNKVMSK